MGAHQDLDQEVSDRRSLQEKHDKAKLMHSAHEQRRLENIRLERRLDALRHKAAARKLKRARRRAQRKAVLNPSITTTTTINPEPTSPVYISSATGWICRVEKGV